MQIRYEAMSLWLVCWAVHWQVTLMIHWSTQLGMLASGFRGWLTVWLASQSGMTLCGRQIYIPDMWAGSANMMLLSDVHEAFSCGLAGRLIILHVWGWLVGIQNLCDLWLCTLSQCGWRHVTSVCACCMRLVVEFHDDVGQWTIRCELCGWPMAFPWEFDYIYELCGWPMAYLGKLATCAG